MDILTYHIILLYCGSYFNVQLLKLLLCIVSVTLMYYVRCLGITSSQLSLNIIMPGTLNIIILMYHASHLKTTITVILK